MAKKHVTTTELIKTTQTTITETTIEEQALPTLEIIEGKVFCTSLQVAEHFEKEHFNVVRDIEEQITKIKAGRHAGSEESMFLKGFYETQAGFGKVKKPMYYLNRDGFMKLVMGYNGARASDIQMDYIEAFNKMEAMLLNLSHPKPTTINGQQRLEMRNLVYSLTQFNVANEQINHKVWNVIRFHWNLENVDDLPADQFPAVMQMLSGLQTHMKREFYPAFNQFLVEHMKKWLCGDADDTIQLKKKWYKLFQTELPQPINWKQVAQQLELKAA